MPDKPTYSTEVLSKQQIRNMERGIGCVNCGSPSTKIYKNYEVCDNIGCMRSLKIIWNGNRSARRAGNSEQGPEQD
jgi:hypothetical protein